jgi:hypothetical protein
MEVDDQLPAFKIVKDWRGIQSEMGGNQIRSFVGQKTFQMLASAAEAREHASALGGKDIDLTIGADAHIGRRRDDAGNFDAVLRQMPDQIRKHPARAAGTLRGPRYSNLERSHRSSGPPSTSVIQPF